MLELKREDLIEEMCERCKTTGDLTNQTPSAFPEIGITDGGIVNKKCPECNGLGANLTPTGEVIRDFVHWLHHTGQCNRSSISFGGR